MTAKTDFFPILVRYNPFVPILKLNVCILFTDVLHMAKNQSCNAINLLNLNTDNVLIKNYQNPITWEKQD